MKKYFIFTLMMLSALSLSARNNWIYTGFEYSRVYESLTFDKDDSKRELHSMGVNLSAYSYNDYSPLGFFIHTSLLFPHALAIEDGGDRDIYNQNDVAHFYYYNGLAGIALRTPASVIQGYGGIGIHGSSLVLGIGSAYYDEYHSQKSYAVGIGIDLGLKVNFTDHFYLNIGAMGAWDFYNYTDMYINGSKEDYEYDSFHAFVINPFGGLGISF